MRNAGILLLLMFAAGCNIDRGNQAVREARPVEIEHGANVADRTRANAPATLEGEWRVAGADGKSIDLTHGITMSITPERISLNSGCVNMAWRYNYAAGELAAEPLAQKTCKRGLHPEEKAIAAVLDGSADVRRTEHNGVEIVGGGHGFILFSQ